MKHKKDVSVKDIQVVRDMYKDHTADEIAARLGRTRQSIYEIARIHGIKKNSPQGEIEVWHSMEECEYLGHHFESFQHHAGRRKMYKVDGEPSSLQVIANICGLGLRTLVKRLETGRHPLSECLIPANTGCWAEQRKRGQDSAAAKHSAKRIARHSDEKFIKGDRTPLQGAELFSAKWLRINLLAHP